MTQESSTIPVRYDGRDIPMDAAIACDDDLLKQALMPHLGAEIANATISREGEGRQMVVTLTKRAGPKGAVAGFAGLIAATEQINPVFGVAWMLRWNDARGTLDFLSLSELQTVIDTTIAQGDAEERHTRRSLSQLHHAPASATHAIVIGF